MRVLVTGATGFVGRALVPHLVRMGHFVRAAVRKSQAIEGVDVLPHGDLSKAVDWRPFCANVDAIVHLAGQAHATRALPDSHYEQINHTTTSDLARAAKAEGVRRFVFVSSIKAQTGSTSRSTITEADVARPVDAYGRSKLAAENSLRELGIPYTIFRPVLIYGGELKGNLATLRKITALPVPLPFGAFRNRRSLLALSGFTRAIELALSSSTMLDQTFVIADREPIALRDLIVAFRKARDRRPMLVPIPVALMRLGLRLAGGPDLWERLGGELVVDPAKLVAAGWIPGDSTGTMLEQVLRADQREQTKIV